MQAQGELYSERHQNARTFHYSLQNRKVKGKQRMGFPQKHLPVPPSKMVRQNSVVFGLKIGQLFVIC